MGNVSFDSTLKEIRIQAKKTVPEVSQYLTSLGHKASEKTVYSWEAGRSRPTIDIFLDMCKFYGVSDVFSYFGDEAFEEKDVLSAIEQAHIKKYRALDPYGKEAVDGVLDVEWRRCAEIINQKKQQPEAAEETAFYIISWYPQPMSAGTGTEAGGEEPEELLLRKRPPRGASYVAPVSGDSMEPTFHNGDKLFIRAQAVIRPGQIGVFFMDGKQWVKELGDGVLISHNPDPEYAPRPFTEDIRCQGLVLGVCDESYFE